MMRSKGVFVKAWALLGATTMFLSIGALFAFVFWKGAVVVDADFLFSPPKGAVLGEEGGIYPAVIGSIWFTAGSVVIGGVPAFLIAVYLTFMRSSEKAQTAGQLVLRCAAGIPSIVLGMFAYSLFVKDLSWGRSILSASIALGIMIMPYIETLIEKAFREVPSHMIESSRALGFSRMKILGLVILPMCSGEIVAALILGACFSMGATAPLIFTGGVAFASAPTDMLRPAMALPLHLYLLVSQGGNSIEAAYGTALVMMVLVLAGNIVARMLAQRSRSKWRT